MLKYCFKVRSMKKEKSFKIINNFHNDEKYRSKHFKDKFYQKKCLQTYLIKVNYDLKMFLRLCVRQMSFLIFDFALGRKQEKQLTPAEGAVSFTLHRLCTVISCGEAMTLNRTFCRNRVS